MYYQLLRERNNKLTFSRGKKSSDATFNQELQLVCWLTELQR